MQPRQLSQQGTAATIYFVMFTSFIQITNRTLEILSFNTQGTEIEKITFDTTDIYLKLSKGYRRRHYKQ